MLKQAPFSLSSIVWPASCHSLLQHLDGIQSHLRVDQETCDHQGLPKVKDEGEKLPEDGAGDSPHAAAGWG